MQMEKCNQTKQKTYYFYYVEQERMQQVSATVFKKVSGTVWVPNEAKIVKILFQDASGKNGKMPRVKVSLKKWAAQSFVGDVRQMFQMIPQLLKLSKIAGDMLSPSGLARISSLVVRIIKLISRDDIDLSLITSIILDAYSFSGFAAQSMDTILLGCAIEFLPQVVKNLLRSINSVSRIKIGDDYPMWQWLTTIVSNVLDFILSILPLSADLKNKLEGLKHWIPVGEAYNILGDMTKSLEMYEKDKKLVGDMSFQLRVEEIEERHKRNQDLQEMKRFSNSAARKVLMWDRLVTNILSYKNTSRVEPAMFVFDGPPGTLKSVIMTKLLSSLNLSVYSHLIKATQDGKDFYDTYDNQEVFYLDDVGQQGRSQWRTFINMISSVRMPLECACVTLKDTKYFSSEIVMLTTNNFMKLQGFTESDCITNPEALFRRGLVFDFSGLKREGGLVHGTVSFKVYNQKSKSFEEAPVQGMKWSKTIPFHLEVEATTNSLLRMVSWMKAIVLQVRSFKRANHVTASTSQEEKELMQQFDEEFACEGATMSAIGVDQGQGFVIDRIDLPDEFGYSIHDVSAILIEDQTEQDRDLPTRKLFVDSSWDKYLKPIWYETIIAHLQEVAKVIWDQIMALAASGWTFAKKEPQISSLILVYCSVLVVALLVGRSSKTVVKGSFVGQELKNVLSYFSKNKVSVSSQEMKIQKHLYQVSVVNNDDSVVWGLCTGRFIILPGHAILEEIKEPVICVWKSMEDKHAILDHFTTSVIWRCNEDDVVVLDLGKSFPTPFKKCKVSVGSAAVDHLTIDRGSLSIPSIRKADTYGTIAYAVSSLAGVETFRNKTLAQNRMIYSIHADGLCGAALTNAEHGVVGMHVAGNRTTGEGLAIVWSLKTRQYLNSIVEFQREAQILDIHDKKLVEFSGVKLQAEVGASVPTATHIVPSPLYGIYDVDREPANLTKYGPCTVKDVMKKSMKLVKPIKQEELAFAELVLRSIVKPFKSVEEKMIVDGNEFISGLNKKSSNGYKMLREKCEYVDFSKGELTPLCRQLLEELESGIRQGLPDLEKFFWVETLKDEIRNVEKDGVPRSFRVGTILHQILTKKLFAGMTEQVMRERDFNQIMIGCNPVTAWPKIYDDLLTGKVFAGDISNWDGNMAPQVQQLVTRVFTDLCEDKNDKPLVEFVLQMMHTSLVVVQDDLYMTTHSMPSGSFLTATLNSIINKLYTAIWFFRNSPDKTLTAYWSNVSDYVYGDDKVNVVRKYHDTLNAVTMKEFFESVGMGFTDAKKQPIVTPFQEIDEISFLKRSFVLHNKLFQIVPALEIRTLKNTLSWVDKDKDAFEIMHDKINNFQREVYLHPDRVELKTDLFSKLKSINYNFRELSDSYLQNLYRLSPSDYLTKYY
jgi:hypothetical protein